MSCDKLFSCFGKFLPPTDLELSELPKLDKLNENRNESSKPTIGETLFTKDSEKSKFNSKLNKKTHQSSKDYDNNVSDSELDKSKENTFIMNICNTFLLDDDL